MASVMPKIDRFQRGRRWAAVVVATGLKFKEDRSPMLAATVAFWAFFSIFPLLLVMVTLAGWLLPESLKADVLENVSKMLPLLDPSTAGGLQGSTWALVLGLLTALWSGSAVVRVTQLAFSSVWEIPMRDRPKLVETVGRSLWVLATIGLGLVGAILLSSFINSSADVVNLGWFARLAGYAVALVVDIGLFVAAFRILTDRDVEIGDVLPGAIFAGAAFFVLQQASTLLIGRYLGNAEATYGTFATVITILWWFYLQSQLTLVGAQLNVVLKDRLWPRSLVGGPETDADHRVLEAYARERAYEPEEEIDVRIHDRDAEESRAAMR